jgi:uncharacterized delta-60 repeat protein
MARNRPRWFVAMVAAVLAALVVAAAPARAARGRSQPGDLDPAFGQQGKVVKAVGAVSGADAVTTLANGKLLVAGYSGNDILLMRFTAAGKVDNSFSGDGKVTTSFPGKGASAGSLAIVAGGKIVVAGSVYASGQPNSEDVVVARYLANGDPDPAFGGGDGRVVSDLFGGDDQLEAMAVGSDGKPVLAVMADHSGSLRATIVRYTTAGTLDPSFSSDGKFLLSQAGDPFIEAVTVLPSLKIVAAGQGETATTLDFVLYGVKKGGATDQNFGTFGIATTDFGDGADVADALAVDSHGRIVAGGAGGVGGEEEFALARYAKTGQPDTHFSGDGKATLNLADGFDRVFALAFQGQKIIAGGRSDSGNDERWGLARFGSGGAADSAFGSGGVAIVNFSADTNKEEEVSGLTYEADAHRIVACGFTGNRVALAGLLG